MECMVKLLIYWSVDYVSSSWWQLLVTTYYRFSPFWLFPNLVLQSSHCPTIGKVIESIKVVLFFSSTFPSIIGFSRELGFHIMVWRRIMCVCAYFVPQVRTLDYLFRWWSYLIRRLTSSPSIFLGGLLEFCHFPQNVNLGFHLSMLAYEPGMR